MACVFTTAIQQHVSMDQRQQHAAAALSLVSYDVEARMRMFGWLNRYVSTVVAVSREFFADEVGHFVGCWVFLLPAIDVQGFDVSDC